MMDSEFQKVGDSDRINLRKRKHVNNSDPDSSFNSNESKEGTYTPEDDDGNSKWVLEIRYFNKLNMYETLTLEQLIDDESKLSMYKFLRRQIDLYTSIARDRNALHGRYYQRKFPPEFLSAALKNDKYPEDLKATFLRMFVYLYIDKAPRKKKVYPKMIRSRRKFVSFDAKNNSTNQKVKRNEYYLINEDYEEEGAIPIVDNLTDKEQQQTELRVLSEIKFYLIEILENKASKLGHSK